VHLRNHKLLQLHCWSLSTEAWFSAPNEAHKRKGMGSKLCSSKLPISPKCTGPKKIQKLCVNFVWSLTAMRQAVMQLQSEKNSCRRGGKAKRRMASLVTFAQALKQSYTLTRECFVLSTVSLEYTRCFKNPLSFVFSFENFSQTAITKKLQFNKL